MSMFFKFDLGFVTGWQDIIDSNGKNQGQLFLKVIYKPYLNERGERSAQGKQKCSKLESF